MKPERLAEIKELLSKITPGEWSRDSIYWILRYYWKSGVDLDNVPDDAIEPKYRGLDPEFIAAAPKIVAELLAAIEEFQKEDEEEKKEDDLCSCHLSVRQHKDHCTIWINSLGHPWLGQYDHEPCYETDCGKMDYEHKRIQKNWPEAES